MDFLGNILAVHLVQDILERGNIVVIPQGVDTVVHGDIADTVSWEKVLNQMPGLQNGKLTISAMVPKNQRYGYNPSVGKN